MDRDASFLSFLSQEGRVGHVQPRDSAIECCAAASGVLFPRVSFQSAVALHLKYGVQSSLRDAKFPIRKVSQRGYSERDVEDRRINLISRYWECVLHVEEGRVDADWICNRRELCGPDVFFEGVVVESRKSYKL